MSLAGKYVDLVEVIHSHLWLTWVVGKKKKGRGRETSQIE